MWISEVVRRKYEIDHRFRKRGRKSIKDAGAKEKTRRRAGEDVVYPIDLEFGDDPKVRYNSSLSSLEL